MRWRRAGNTLIREYLFLCDTSTILQVTTALKHLERSSLKWWNFVLILCIFPTTKCTFISQSVEQEEPCNFYPHLIVSICSQMWELWLQWLSPFFCIDEVLPYTFLAILDEFQFLSIMEKMTVELALKLPLNALIGLVAYQLQYVKDHKVSFLCPILFKIWFVLERIV